MAKGDAVRGALELGGAESVDRAREMWWLGLREVEKEKYTAVSVNFEKDEHVFRKGFEAALQLRNRNRSYDACYKELGDRDARACGIEAFKRG